MKWLGYMWCVIVNLFYWIVVCAVLLDIRNPMEKSIIAVLGILYATIRGIAISNALVFMNAATGLQSQIDQIRRQVDQAFEMPDHTEVLEIASRSRVKLYITGCFLGLISISCLVGFFTAHNS